MVPATTPEEEWALVYCSGIRRTWGGMEIRLSPRTGLLVTSWQGWSPGVAFLVCVALHCTHSVPPLLGCAIGCRYGLFVDFRPPSRATMQRNSCPTAFLP